MHHAWTFDQQSQAASACPILLYVPAQQVCHAGALTEVRHDPLCLSGDSEGANTPPAHEMISLEQGTELKRKWA